MLYTEEVNLVEKAHATIGPYQVNHGMSMLTTSGTLYTKAVQ